MKTKGEREKQNPAHRPKHNVRHQKNLSLCFPRGKSKPLECCLTLFSNQIWKESGSSAISPLQNYPEAPSGQQRLRPLDTRGQGCPGCRVGIGYSGLVLSEEGNSAFLSHCLRGDRPVVELYVDPAGFSGR